MGTTIKYTSISMNILKKSNIPIILCEPPKRYMKNIIEDSDIHISFNKIFAEKIINIDKSQRNSVAYDEAKHIFMESDTQLFISDFEMLFDPRFQIDVMKLFCEIARKRKLWVLWCGKFTDKFLTFATPEDKDYHSYEIKKYDITCVQ